MMNKINKILVACLVTLSACGVSAQTSKSVRTTPPRTYFEVQQDTAKYTHRQVFEDIVVYSSLTEAELRAAREPRVTEPRSIREIPETMPEGWLLTNRSVTSTAAVSGTNSFHMNRSISPNLPNSMVGLLPGLSISMGNGIPGESNASWLIRGIGSYTYGRENESKIYVDGFEVDAAFMSFMIPDEIENVSVLKDAAALTLFGMTGSNGVIWITTKRGAIGKPRVNVNLRTGFQQPVNVSKSLGAYDFANLYNQAVSNDNGMVWSPAYTDAQLQGYLNGTEPDIDWYKEVMKSSANYTDASVSVSGGVEAARYNVMLGYSNHQGLLNVSNTDQTSNLNMGRFNLRANLDLEFLRIFEAKIDIGGRLEDRSQPNYDTGSLMENIARYPSNAYWVYDNPEMTHYSGTTLYRDNPVGSIKGLGHRSSRTRVMQANFLLREKFDFITPGLYMEEAVSFYSSARNGYDKTGNYSRWLNGSTTTTDQDEPLKASSYNSNGMIDWKQARIAVGYKHSFGLNNLDLITTFGISDRKGDGLFNYKRRHTNWNGRFNYNYDSRYTAEVGFSYFGSDAFMKGNQWGFYPSVSAAWIISNEKFLRSSTAVQFLKLRASVGKTGSHEAGDSVNVGGYNSYGRYLYKQYYHWSSSFYTGNTTPYAGNSSIVPSFIANPDIFAESSWKYNVGIDLNLWNKLDLTADFFLDKRSDILTPDNSIMGYYGNISYISNIGKMTNKGFEVGLNYTDRFGQVGFSLYGAAAYAVNKIDYMAEVTPRYGYNAKTGHSYNARIGLIADGFYQMEDFNSDGTLKDGLAVPQFGKVQAGDIRYADLDGDGFVDDTDVRKIGDGHYPKLTYSFGVALDWKGFDLGVMFRGAAGAYVNLMEDRYKTYFVAFMDNRNAFPVAQGAWAYYRDQNIDTRGTATYPRLTTTSNENNYRTSSFWMRKNNYLRVQNIEIGYDFAKHLIRTDRVGAMRLYLNATNPFTFSSLLKDYDMDPETGFGYPAIRLWSVGVSITL